MKLLTYGQAQGTRCGVIKGDSVVDVSSLLKLDNPLKDVQALLELDENILAKLQSALDESTTHNSILLSEAKLFSPILQPPTIRDFMIFEEHATAQGTRERQEAWYRMPIFYFSNTLCVLGTEDSFPHPDTCERLDYELEIACIIGKEGRNVPASAAMDYIAGFCIFNDWSCRDIQADESSVGLGPAKGKDSASSLGPWMVTTDEMAPFLKEGRLHVKCSAKVNGDYWVKDSNAGVSYHTWGDMIERASKDSRIAPGDVLGCGTVGGGSIGEAIRKGFPQARFLLPGDVVEMEVEGLGNLVGRIDPPESPNPNYRYKVTSLPPIPERGIAKDYKYEFKNRA